MNKIKSICLLGFGEVGSTLAPALQEKVESLTAFDVESKQTSCTGVTISHSVENAIQDADLVISVVTAAQALDAANSAAPLLKNNAYYWDLNSVSPKTKQSIEALINDKGCFVEGAIMSPINPKGIEAPILVGGAFAEEFSKLAIELGFKGSQFISVDTGKAAASKMCRSVIIKGLESLITESLLSARHYGVEEQVLKSLSNLMPGIDWDQHSAYMISRSLAHGVRRAEEMREVNKTVKDAGLLGLMSAACADTQAWTAEFNQHVDAESLTTLLDQFREKL